ncbi:hypothetical protein TPA4_78 [Tsukamurella phage TPA4]|uniref:hypothetical protein n=1 Tax=Tsukamurella phage TPA4 TaxID=1647476 RepID=UPI0007B60F39|nr:hypothetical protein BH784_gp78 [Tsukamurella phage TPA4]AKJ72243.1 hypothetical protein TPA4_78 [Tsukamurella phage TPA4]
MSTRTTRRDRRNAEHGHDWTNHEREHLRFVAQRTRLLAIADGRVKLPPRLRRHGGSLHIAPGLPWLTIVPDVKEFKTELTRQLATIGNGIRS